MSPIRATEEPAPINLDAEIGRRAHRLMWDRHVTQVEFGKIIGMDQSAVAKRFRGKLGWSATQVKTAADALETTVAYLYGEADSPHPDGPVGPGGFEPPTFTVEYGRLATVTPINRAA